MALRLLSVVLALFVTVSSTIQSNAQTLASPQKYILGYDGNDVGAAPLSPSLNLGNEFTMEVWIYLVDLPQPNNMIMGKHFEGGDPYRHYAIQLTSQGNPNFVQTTGQPGTLFGVSGPNPLPVRQWTHLAATLGGGVQRLFVNGQQVSQGPSPGTPAGSDVRFGVGGPVRVCTLAAYCGHLRSGFLRQARVWNRALPQAEIAAKMNTKLPPSETGLAAQWMLDDGIGLVADDSGPNNLDLTFGNSLSADLQTPHWAKAKIIESGPYFVATQQQYGSYAPGARLIDFDLDNDLDVVDFRGYVDFLGPAFAFRNNGSGVFSDVTSQIFSPSTITTISPRHFAIGDFTGDGLKDLFVADHGNDVPPQNGGQSRIFVQTASGQLVDETSTRLPAISAFTHNVAAADIDIDGDLDLYLANLCYGPPVGPRFYLNNGTGHFLADTSRLPASVTSCQQPIKYPSAMFLDVNGDGRPDLYLGNDANTAPRDTLLINSASGNFDFAPTNSLPPRVGGANWFASNIEKADLNNDGLSDLLLSIHIAGNTDAMVQILYNNGNGTMRDGTTGLDRQPISSTVVGDGIPFVVPGDFNGDGRMDFMSSSVALRPSLYINHGGERFVDFGEALPMNVYQGLDFNAENPLPGDLDNDNDIDIFVSNAHSHNMVLKNIKAIVIPGSAFDFDGDRKTDLSIFRPNGTVSEWWWLRSSDGGNSALQFGAATDVLAPVDFTGDGKTDVAFWRPGTGQWFVLRSEDFSFYAFPFGANGDVPVPADFDGDGKADPAVFRESSSTWYINKSSGGTDIFGFGSAGDKTAVADYDGDGKADVAIFRPVGVNGAEWWVRRSSNAVVVALQFGASTDKAVPGDFTGDGKADIAFWRPSTGFWNVLRSKDLSYFAFPFGTTGDVPVAGDYDGDGKTDAGVFRPSNSTWFIQRSTAGTLIQQFGAAGDVPLPSAFVR